jgi:hypothetical protein
LLWLNGTSESLESAKSLTSKTIVRMSRNIRSLNLDHVVSLIHRWLIHDIFMLGVRLMSESSRADVANRAGSTLTWRRDGAHLSRTLWIVGRGPGGNRESRNDSSGGNGSTLISALLLGGLGRRALNTRLSVRVWLCILIASVILYGTCLTLEGACLRIRRSGIGESSSRGCTWICDLLGLRFVLLFRLIWLCGSGFSRLCWLVKSLRCITRGRGLF